MSKKGKGQGRRGGGHVRGGKQELELGVLREERLLEVLDLVVRDGHVREAGGGSKVWQLGQLVVAQVSMESGGGSRGVKEYEKERERMMEEETNNDRSEGREFMASVGREVRLFPSTSLCVAGACVCRSV